MDYFSKQVEAIPNQETSTVAEVLVDELFSRFGFSPFRARQEFRARTILKPVPNNGISKGKSNSLGPRVRRREASSRRCTRETRIAIYRFFPDGVSFGRIRNNRPNTSQGAVGKVDETAWWPSTMKKSLRKFLCFFFFY